MLQGEPGSVVPGGTVPGRKGESGFPGTPVSVFLRKQDDLLLALLAGVRLASLSPKT